MTAILSPCKQYRYLLSRNNDSLFAKIEPVLFCCLNPSTADATKNDPTTARLRSFTNAWGSRGFSIVNLYAFRSKEPADLKTAADPVGPDNDGHLHAQLEKFGRVICGWGNGADPKRVERFCQIADNAGASLWCLDSNKNGSPKHPLYIKGDTTLKPWETQSC